MQSILKSVTPVLTASGTQRSWESKNFPGINYDFTVTMENGDVGTVSSKKQEGNFIVGKEYTYEKESDSQGRVKFKNFRLFDNILSQFNKGNGQKGPQFWDQPEVVHVTTKNISLEIANDFLSKLPPSLMTSLKADTIMSIADNVYQWCYHGTEEKPEVPNWGKKIIERRHALQRSIEQISVLNKDISDANDVFLEALDRAEHIFSWLNTTHQIHLTQKSPAVAQ
jgi:hypothetical protein